MSNMSYCRFENTARDLADCLASIVDGDDLSPSETNARKRLLVLCREILDAAADGNEGAADGNEDDDAQSRGGA